MTTSLDFAEVPSFNSHLRSRMCDWAGGSARSVAPLPVCDGAGVCHRLSSPPPCYLARGRYQEFVVIKIHIWGLMGLSTFNFKVHAPVSCTLGMTASHADPACSLGHSSEWLLEQGCRKETSSAKGGSTEMSGWYQRRNSQAGDKPGKSQISGSLTAEQEARASANIAGRGQTWEQQRQQKREQKRPGRGADGVAQLDIFQWADGERFQNRCFKKNQSTMRTVKTITVYNKLI